MLLLITLLRGGGVNGRPACPDVLLSAGFKIWKEHINVSSIVIIAPALSNSPQ